VSLLRHFFQQNHENKIKTRKEKKAGKTMAGNREDSDYQRKEIPALRMSYSQWGFIATDY